MFQLQTWKPYLKLYRQLVKISIELFGQLSPVSPRRQSLDLAEHATVQDAASLLGLQQDEIGLITINGVQSELQDLLTPGCRLCLFPYISGG
jgi:hypothetical protein